MPAETLLERLSARAVATAGQNGTAEDVRAAINIEGLRDVGFEIADGQRRDAEEWVAQILAIASVMPWLRNAEPITDLLEEAEALIRSHPERFAAAAHLAVVRSRGRWVSDLVDALLATGTPIPAAEPGDAARAAAVLARLFTKVDATLLRDADEAIGDRLAWEVEVRGLRASGAAGWSAHASGGHADQQVRLRGDLVLSRYGGAVFVEWHGAGSPTLRFRTDAGSIDAPRTSSPGCTVAWLLSDARVAEAEFTNGSEHFRVTLPQ